MGKERTGGMTAIAVLNFTFSGMSIFSFIIVLLTASFYLTHPLMGFSRDTCKNAP